MIPARPRTKRCPTPPLEVWVHREVMYRDATGRESVLYTASLWDRTEGKLLLGEYITPAFVKREDAIAKLLTRKQYSALARRKYVLRGAL